MAYLWLVELNASGKYALSRRGQIYTFNFHSMWNGVWQDAYVGHIILDVTRCNANKYPSRSCGQRASRGRVSTFYQCYFSLRRYYISPFQQYPVERAPRCNCEMNIYLRRPPPNPTSRLSLARLLMGISHPVHTFLPFRLFTAQPGADTQTANFDNQAANFRLRFCDRLEYSTQRRVKSDPDWRALIRMVEDHALHHCECWLIEYTCRCVRDFHLDCHYFVVCNREWFLALPPRISR